MNAAPQPPRSGTSAFSLIRSFAHSLTGESAVADRRIRRGGQANPPWRTGESAVADRPHWLRGNRLLHSSPGPATTRLPLALTYLLLAAVLIATSLGCTAYRFGSFTMYPANIRTVHVPVFRSESIRRDLSEWLTEAVIKEIELKTPYKVVGRDRADSILTGEIIHDQKSVLVETSGDQPRGIALTMLAHVRWTNRHGQLLRPEMNMPLPDTLTMVEESAMLVPEVGQSLASSQQQVTHRLAEQIVAMMEVPW